VPARSHTIVLIAIATLVVGFDQLTKSALVSVIFQHDGDTRRDLVDGMIGLEYTENRGAAFGLFPGLTLVLALASLAILGALLLHYSRQRQPPLWHTIAIRSIAGGALGNLLDRVRFGYVIDFVSIGPWPNFNVADSAITIGVIILLWGWFHAEATWSAARTIDQKGGGSTTDGSRTSMMKNRG